MLALQRDGADWRLDLRGDWSLQGLEQIDTELKALPGPITGVLTCDWSAVERPGIGTVWALLTRLSYLGSSQLEIRHQGHPPHTVELLRKLHIELCTAHGKRTDAVPNPEGAVGGSAAGRCCRPGSAGCPGHFSAASSTCSARAFPHPRALRLPSIVRHVHETGITAIPDRLADRVPHQRDRRLSRRAAAARFGANIFVVDLVTISVLREMGVLLTAIIVAGRSGSAFAAEIGVMRLNEETDALRAMGMNPIELLVVPRVVALIIALPLLTIVADAMGLAGGGLLSLVKLHIPLPQFIARLREALAPTTFWAGLSRRRCSPLLIGMVGTYRGMQVRESARELGRMTTVAVVQSIFMVILADALFAVLFEQIDF